MTKTQLKNALTKAGLLSTVTIQGKNTDFTVETANEAAAAIFVSAGLDIRELRTWEGAPAWRAFGAGWGSSVCSATRELIAANMD